MPMMAVNICQALCTCLALFYVLYRCDFACSQQPTEGGPMISPILQVRPLGLVEKSNYPGANSRCSPQVTSSHCLCAGDPWEPSPPLIFTLESVHYPSFHEGKNHVTNAHCKGKPPGFCWHMQIKKYFKWQYSTSSLFEVLGIPWWAAYFPVGTAPVSSLGCMNWWR